MQVNPTQGEQARLRCTTTSNVKAWSHWVRGLSRFRQPIAKEKFGQARPCWEMALALAPELRCVRDLRDVRGWDNASNDVPVLVGLES